MNSASDSPKRSVGSCVRTASVHIHASTNRGSTPNGNPAVPVALTIIVYGPFRRVYCRASPKLRRGNEHSVSIRAMNATSPGSAAASSSSSTWSATRKLLRSTLPAISSPSTASPYVFMHRSL